MTVLSGETVRAGLVMATRLREGHSPSAHDLKGAPILSGWAIEPIPPSDDAPQLRVDLVVAAVLTAKAIAGEVGLARRLRREAPLVSIATHAADMAPLVGTIIDDCATAGNRRKLTLTRDGTEKSHNNDRGNPEVINSINKRYLVVGIAPDPKRHLPSALLRVSEYRLSLPAVDEWALRLTIEALTGNADIGMVDPAVVRAADISDLGLAIRAGLTPQECLDRLEQVVRTKNEHLHSGPALEQLAGYAEAKEWGLALAADLVEFRAGRIAWDQIDNTALLLSGPPGTGKTTFAAALAKSAGVHLVKTSVADWNSASYLSGTLQAIKDAFGQARRNAPSILFIDEIDGISDRSTLSREYRDVVPLRRITKELDARGYLAPADIEDILGGDHAVNREAAE